MHNTPGQKIQYLPFLIAGWVALIVSNLAMPGEPVVNWFLGSSASAGSVPAPALFPDATAATLGHSTATAPAMKPRCDECGVVDSNRPIAATDSSPVSYEITLRMSDGSMRVLNDPNPASLRPGERIILIGGLSLPNR